MIFLKYFVVKEEFLKNVDELFWKWIWFLFFNLEDDVKEEDENDDDIYDDVIKGNNE